MQERYLKEARIGSTACSTARLAQHEYVADAYSIVLLGN